jgi:hypothetical protein
MRITELLPDAAAVRSMSPESLRGYILQHLNAEADAHYHGSENYSEFRVNYLNGIQDAYKDPDITDLFTAAWRLLEAERYIAEKPSAISPGQYRLTAAGRKITKAAQLQSAPTPPQVTPGMAPAFADAQDKALAAHLQKLWTEGAQCYEANANLATVILLGSLLEGALFAKCQQNDAQVMAASRAPREKGNVKPYRRWSLSDFIAVAEENEWIHVTRNPAAKALRDYRDMVHPANAIAQTYSVDRYTAAISWEVVKGAVSDLRLG